MRPVPPHAAKTRECFDRLIEPLRTTAREHGYALGVHGSLSFDIDLIAAPWAEECSDAATLAEAIRAKTREICGIAFVESYPGYEFPRKKPHGRLCWAFHLGGGPYLDLSVLPKEVRSE